MKFRFDILRLFALSSLFFWTGCNDKEDIDPSLPTEFENGIFISNEGNFGDGDASLSFYDPEVDRVYNNVYRLANEGMELGDVVQSIHLDDERVFLLVNNSNKVEALNLENMVTDYTISDLKLPRYMTTSSTKGYISEWVSFSDIGQVSIVDLKTGIIQKSIQTDYGAEGVIIANNYLFVSNNFSTTVSIIDLASESVIKNIEIGSSPGEMVIDKNGNVWLICGGGYDLDYNPLGDGKLIEIDPSILEVSKVIALGMNVPTKIAIDPNGEIIYYFSGTSAYALNVNATTPPATSLIEEDKAIGFWGIGVDDSGVIYLSDSKGFVENGEVFVYKPDGSFITRFEVGRGPNGFGFN
ncbi:MAG: DUF5074 domain-containing protein [Bacteroidota bacterium]